MSCTLRLRQRSEFKPMQGPDGQSFDDVSYQEVSIEPVKWDKWGRGPGRFWEEVPFVYFEHELDADDLKELIGEGKRLQEVLLHLGSGDDDKAGSEKGVYKTLCVYEIWDKRKVVLVMDHYVPAQDADAQRIVQIARDTAREWRLPNVIDSEGICHVVLPERGHLRPGMLCVGGDSHSPTGGAFGTYMFGIGATEMLHIFISAAGDQVRAGATGKPIPGYQACILDQHGQPVGPGVIGRLAVKGPTGCRYLADARQRDYVGQIQRAAHALLTIINDILDFSKMQAGKVELHPVRFELDDVMHSVATIMSVNAGDKDLELAIGDGQLDAFDFFRVEYTTTGNFPFQ